MKDLALSRVYRFIEPGPVVLVTTKTNEGRPNIMAMSYHMMVNDEVPPLIGCSIGPWNYSFTALRETKECVISIPTVDLATKVVEIGNCSGEEADKFTAFSLTPLPAEKVKPPLIKECFVNLECRVTDDRLVERYNLFIMEVVKAWIEEDREERRVFHHHGDGTFTVDGHTINLKEKMVKWPNYIK